MRRRALKQERARLRAARAPRACSASSARSDGAKLDQYLDLGAQPRDSASPTRACRCDAPAAARSTRPTAALRRRQRARRLQPRHARRPDDRPDRDGAAVRHHARRQLHARRRAQRLRLRLPQGAQVHRHGLDAERRTPVGGYHGLQHAGDRNDGFATIGWWNAQKAAQLAGKLAAIDEGDGRQPARQHRDHASAAACTAATTTRGDLPLALIGGGGKTASGTVLKPTSTSCSAPSSAWPTCT